MADMRKKIDKYIREQYGVEAEFPWAKYDDNAVYRHPENKKWWCIMKYSTLKIE